MASKVRVYNDNTHPFFQKWKDQSILIEPGGFIDMEFYEAHEFKSSYSVVKLDADDNPLPSSFKKLRLVEITEDEKKVEPPPSFQCLACPKTFLNESEFKEHVGTHTNVYDKSKIENAQNKKASQDNYPAVDKIKG